MITIKRGDCLELMKEIPAGSVDMILTDLPYGITDYKYETKIDLGEFWKEARRLMKATGTAAMFASSTFAAKLICSNIDEFKYEWVWVRNNITGFAHAKNCPMRQHEQILIFSGGVIQHKNLTARRMTYNPQGLIPCKGGSRFQRITCNMYGGRRKLSEPHEHNQEFTNYPRDVIYFDSPNSRDHPSQKPVSLLEYLIKTYTNAGETVLDATMGSGSTGVAAINTGRKFIGFELDEQYFKIAQNRLSQNNIFKNSLQN